MTTTLELEERLFAGPFEPGVFTPAQAPTGMHMHEFIFPTSVTTPFSHGGTAEPHSIRFRLPRGAWKDILSGVFTNISSVGTTHVFRAEVSEEAPSHYERMAFDMRAWGATEREPVEEPQVDMWRGIFAVDRPREIVFSQKLHLRTASLRKREMQPPVNLYLAETEE